ncbi:MAG: DNA-binding response regulator [Cytophagales bacterium]|nr:MAG: DNA-binding response regulator [Cytophagales bacterium]
MTLKCMIVEDDEMSRSILKHFIEQTNQIQLIQQCENAIEAYQVLQKEKEIDVIFLDIEMPEMTGLELMQSIQDHHADIIITTSKPEYALEAFEYDVTDYLVKPIKYSRFLKAIQRVETSRRYINSNSINGENDELQQVGFSNNSEVQALFVKSEGRIIKLNYDEVIHIEALADYVIVNATNRKFIVHSTMKGIYSKLQSTKCFIRIHRSHIINLNAIETIEDGLVNVAGGKAIPIGKLYRSEFLEKLNIIS